MNARIVSVCLWLAALSCARGDVVTARSFSGQFTARELRFFEPFGVPQNSQRTVVGGGWAFLLNTPPAADPAQEEVTLDPSLLVLSCERLKNALLSDLTLADRWQGGVNLVIHPNWPQDRAPVLTATHDLSGWSYELEFPKVLRKQILVRAVMEAILLEMANRSAGSQSAQIPFWLVEGLTAHLQAYDVEGFVLQPSLEIAKVRLQGLEAVRAQLRRNSPLTFQRLSWPMDDDLSGAGLQLYRCCAQLFLEELLQFRDGRVCLLSMLSQLPNHLNWQTAFLEGFHPHFEQLLDVEKWWGLSYVEFLQDDAAQSWPAEDCWKKLQAALDIPVQVHFASNQMPAEAAITLQEAIAQWPPADVNTILRRTIGDLELLHCRAPASVRQVSDLYLHILMGYLDVSETTKGPRIIRETSPSGHFKRNAIAQLDALDRRRYAARSSARADNSAVRDARLN